MAASSPKVELLEPHHRGLRLVFGTMTLAGQVDETGAIELLKTFFDFHPEGSYPELDTAFMYCETKTEQMLGKVLTEEQKKRMRIATKANPGHKGGLSAQSISTQLTTSLENMHLEDVDIFYLHWPDPKTDLKQSLKRAHELWKQNKFRELGISNYSAAQVETILSICEANNFVKPTLYQGMYNVLTRAVEADLFEVLRKHNIRFYAYNPLAGGLLSGKYAKYEDQPEEKTRFDDSSVAGKRYKARYWNQVFFDALALIQEAIAKHAPGKALSQVSLSWLHHHSQLKRELFDAIIVGQSNINHLHTNLHSGTDSDETLPQELLAAIEQAWELVKPHCPPYSR